MHLLPISAAALATALLAGCQMPMHHHDHDHHVMPRPGFDCHPTPPLVRVTVAADGEVDVSPPTLCLNSNEPIIFKLETDGYRFPDTGAIAFKPPLPRPGEFDCSTNGSGKMVRCSNARTVVPAAYEYGVTVIRMSDGLPIHKDPFIVNR